MEKNEDVVEELDEIKRCTRPAKVASLRKFIVERFKDRIFVIF